MPQLNKLFGEHRFVRNSNGRGQSAKVVNLADWSGTLRVLWKPHERETADVVITHLGRCAA